MRCASMQHYYFNMHNGGDHPDPTGMWLKTLGVARDTAGQLAADMLREYPSECWNRSDCKVEATNDEGLILFTIIISAFDAPACAGNAP